MVYGDKMDKIAVLIPCYNEERTIRKVILDFRSVLADATIYVYDNNSTDRTAQIAVDEGAIVRHEYRQGKGNVIRRMFREVDALCYILVDGDDTYPAKFAPEMVRLILEKTADMVIGDRLSSNYYTENDRRFHGVGNRLVCKLVNDLFKADINDIMTGYRALSYEFVKTFPVLSRGFEIETEMSIHAVDKNFQIDNIVVDYRNRPKDSFSKINTFSDGLKVMRAIVRLYKTYKPLTFFGLIFVLLACISLVFFIPVMNEYILTGLVKRFPTLIVCGFIMIAAIQSLFAGLELHSMAQKERQDFEMYLHLVSWRKQDMEAKLR